MELIEYKLLVEKQFGKIQLPDSSEEVDEILCALEACLEVVSKEDYHILQAIDIIICWRNDNDSFRGQTQSDNSGVV